MQQNARAKEDIHEEKRGCTDVLPRIPYILRSEVEVRFNEGTGLGVACFMRLKRQVGMKIKKKEKKKSVEEGKNNVRENLNIYIN